MATANSVPVVYLAFANALDDHLATLKEESRAIYKILQPMEKAQKLRVHREESSQVDELYEDLLSYDQDIVVFHYGGHADGSMLQLEEGRGSAGGLAKLLGQQKSLKLVFLNGCATKDQVRLLHQAGVPTVIATAVKINDTKATIFSSSFYTALAAGKSIEESFESAQSLIETKFAAEDLFDISFNRFPAWDDSEVSDEELEEEAEEVGFEWSLYNRADAGEDVGMWRLTNAQEDWLLQLKDHQGPIRSWVDDSPLKIQHRSNLRTFRSRLCTQCGFSLAYAGKDEIGLTICPRCYSSSAETPDTSMALPDEVLDPVISEKKAKLIAQQVLETALNNGKASKDLEPQEVQQYWSPVWAFDLELQTKFKGQAGYITAFSADKPSMDWREVEDQIDTKLERHLVPANRDLLVSGLDDIAFTQARAYRPEDALIPTVAPVAGLEETFSQVSADLKSYLRKEIEQRISGVEQKSITSSTRYDHVRAKLAWLPMWVFTVPTDSDNHTVVVNGLNGEFNFGRVSDFATTSYEAQGLINKTKTALLAGEHTRFEIFASIFGALGIGIMVGLLMGLAAPANADTKSVVSIFIGAVGVGLAALLGLNDRHFSVAKGLRIGTFGLSVAISALTGLYVRDHGLLSPSLEERVAIMKRITPNLNNDEILSLLGGATMTPSVMYDVVADSSGVVQTAAVPIPSGGSYLYSESL
ncbi:MAG: CHAT domain-containing protein, partial [Pseudomonadota bacterium]